MIEWLENFLSATNLTLFMVTHDRYFMEHLCDNILELDGGELFKYSGSYSDFLEKKALRTENEAIELDKTKKLYRKELDWMRRSPKARTTKANARIDRFYGIEDKASQRMGKDEIQIDLKGQRLGSKILELHYISKSYGKLCIANEFHYKFKKGEKVGIVGKNGIGKSTLLRILTGEEAPDRGKVVAGETVVFGHYTQEGISGGTFSSQSNDDVRIDSDKRVIDFITGIAEYIPLEKGQKLGAAQLLERFLFSRPQQQVYISQLSGGERRRLYLLSVLMRNPNFLILDEPTNDLDVITLNVLEEWLLDFPGCVVIVSHDRFLLDKLCDHLLILEGEGKIKDFNGRYMDYRAMQVEREREIKRIEREVTEKPKIPQVRTASGLTSTEKNEMKKLEREIAALEERKRQIHEQFSAPGVSVDEIQKLSIELKNVEENLESKEMRWLELSEK
jgi:ATP-binding cassette subfamily F protein uup